MERIVISISLLSKRNWSYIYQFIKSIAHSADIIEKQNTYVKISNIASVRLERNLAKESGFDANILTGEPLLSEDLGDISPATCYSIIYQKADDAEDFAEILPFLLLHKEFNDCVSLGIDLDLLNVECQQRYKFRVSEFLVFIDLQKPRCGSRSIYLLNERKLDRQTGEMTYASPFRVSSLAGKGLGAEKSYFGESSRRFLPLIHITEESYRNIFGTENDEGAIELSFIRESIEKIKASPIIEKIYKYFATNVVSLPETSFGQWLFASYLYSHTKEELGKLGLPELEGIKRVMQIYENSIFELIQNIIFHGGREGLFYCVFDRKRNVAASYAKSIPHFEKYNDDVRFLRIGVFDYSNKGIVNTYRERNALTGEMLHLSLRDFFDTTALSTTGLTTLDLRYAARLGIKTFVKTIIRHGGYFRVESNDAGSDRQTKRVMQTEVRDGAAWLGRVRETSFASGTHYEIVMPVTPVDIRPTKSVPLQRNSLLSGSGMKNLPSNSIKSFTMPIEALLAVSNSNSKGQQIKKIIEVSNQIILKHKALLGTNKSGALALDMEGHALEPKLIFKILSYIQLCSDSGFERIYMVNVQDSFLRDFCGILDPLVSYENGDNIWSRSSAIVLISVNLHVQIIWGKTKDELSYVNNRIQHFFCNYFFAPSEGWMAEIGNCCIKEDVKRKADNLICPFDIIVTNERGETLFEEFVTRLLKRKVISNELGCLVNHENTYIGNKIIVKNYYEADMLFQNNFFVERFSYLVACRIKDILTSQYNHRGKRKSKSKLVLIGYQPYSEFLLKSIRRALTGEDVYIVIGRDDKDVQSIEQFFDFEVTYKGSSIQEEIISNTEEFQFITIVPIGSTLSTNDKLIAFFKQWYKHEKQKSPHSLLHSVLTDSQFIYSHCVIVVRDNTTVDTTSLEQEQRWIKEGVSLEERTVTMSYNNVSRVGFNIQIASNTSSGNECNWFRRLNDEISYPSEWWREKYVNYTENASINSQNLMGLPKVELVSEEEYIEELNRLNDFRKYIFKGHVDVFGEHHKYYINTEAFTKRNERKLSVWLNDVLRKENDKKFSSEKLNVIITPNAECESDFVRIVNDVIFGGAALVVYMDVRNWRNNIVYKLSYLQEISPDKVQYYYVDHALLTGETYQKTKSYLFSILKYKRVGFAAVITIVNRLPFAKAKELKNDVNDSFYAYASLYYPSNIGSMECELCRLQKYYDDLKSRTVFSSCETIIQRNQDKIMLRTARGFENPQSQCSDTDFLRLILVHDLFYRISETAQKKEGERLEYEDVVRQIESDLDLTYSELAGLSFGNDENSGQKLNAIIDKWYSLELLDSLPELRRYYEKRIEIDKKLSFLKVISSPPLSKYISIRKYAYGKLLHELHHVIEKPQDDYVYGDLLVVKAVLKSLSFLKSNALVRKDVIVGVWRVLSNVMENLEKERSNLNYLRIKVKERLRYLNWNIKKKEINDSGDLFGIDVSVYKKQRDLVSRLREIIQGELEATKDKSAIVKDFGTHVQFYVKNAILDDEAKATFLGELLRTGCEPSDYNPIRISTTSLSLKNVNDREADNSLFQAELGSGSTILKTEYINFLVWLFYDNTTILRKTLENFTKEIVKGNVCHDLFYAENNSLRSIKDIKDNICNAKRIICEKVNEEYYYHSFRPYLDNGDGVDFLEKLIYATYAKLKLVDLISYHHKTHIETDTRDLMEAFASIMQADMAFWTMNRHMGENSNEKLKKHTLRGLYPISMYGKVDETHDNRWDYDRWMLQDNFYTGKIHTFKQSKGIKYPVVPIYNLEESIGERKELKAQSLGVFVITNNYNIEGNCRGEGAIVASISFLFKKDNDNVKDERTFRVNLQESGRLMLLLKNDINRYVVDYLIHDKTFELWVEKFWNERRFEKIYSNSAHRFNAVYKEMEEFESLSTLNIRNMSNTWYFLSNETISFIYANIERSVTGKGNTHYLDMRETYLAEKGNTLGATFNNTFRDILVSLLESDRWKGIDGGSNQLFINGQPIERFVLDEEMANVPLHCNKHLMRTFIAQCLQNSLAPLSRHGHRGELEIKRVDLTIEKYKICIKDTALNDYYPAKVLESRAVNFRRKKKLIESMNCEEYSSTTLTSLQGFVNYMQSNGWAYNCSFGFDETWNFYVELIFDNKHEENTVYRG